MKRPYEQIDVDDEGSVACVRIRPRRLEETAIHTLGKEITDLIEQGNCRQMVLSLGPGTLECLYSIFMAKLVAVHRRLQDHQGRLIICDVTPEVMSVFEACRLKAYFEFAADRAAALAAMNRKPIS